jgi:hypothetical protein
MDFADDHFGAGGVYQPVFIRITRESRFPSQPGGKELEHG